MYEYWYDYTKPKYGGNTKLCYTHADSLIVNVKCENVYADLHTNKLLGTKICKTKRYKLFYHE